VTLVVTSSGITSSSATIVGVAVVIIVVASSATSALATTWWIVVVVGRPTIATAWRREVTRDVFDAVVTSAVDQLGTSRSRSFAALDVCLFTHIVRLVSLAWAHANLGTE
jgi:hypothetical protein